jgi:thiosulfate/3-mercaptopyruvate sulfurtransferase
MSERLIEPEGLRGRLGSEDVLVIDARPPEAYAAGHLPGALSLPEVYDELVTDTRPEGLARFHDFLGDLFARAGITGEEQVIFYEEATGMRCARGLWLLEYAGHPRVSVLHGGLRGWVEAGSALTRAPAVRPRSAFSPRPRAELLATAEDLLAARGRPGVVLLDVRREEEYRGSFLQECCPRSGRVPGAVWLEWDRLREGPRFRTPNGMRAELAAVGVTPEKEIMPYCHRGARSAHTYLALKLLGYPHVRNAIGSWHEWSNRPELPLEADP